MDNKVNNNNENKMEEKKMEKKITMVDLKTAMENANDARANTDSKLACEYLDTRAIWTPLLPIITRDCLPTTMLP